MVLKHFVLYVMPLHAEGTALHAAGTQSQDVTHKLDVECTVDAMACMLANMGVSKQYRFEVWQGLFLRWEVISGVIIEHGVTNHG